MLPFVLKAISTPESNDLLSFASSSIISYSFNATPLPQSDSWPQILLCATRFLILGSLHKKDPRRSSLCGLLEKCTNQSKQPWFSSERKFSFLGVCGLCISEILTGLSFLSRRSRRRAKFSSFQSQAGREYQTESRWDSGQQKIARCAT